MWLHMKVYTLQFYIYIDMYISIYIIYILVDLSLILLIFFCSCFLSQKNVFAVNRFNFRGDSLASSHLLLRDSQTHQRTSVNVSEVV